MDSSIDDLIYVDSTIDNNCCRMTRSKTRNNRSIDDALVYVDANSENKKRRSARRRKRNNNSNRERNKEVFPVDVIDLVDEVESPVNDVKSNEKKDKVMVDDWLDITLDADVEDEGTELLEEVKVLWYNTTNKIERFTLKRSDPFLQIFEHFAKLNNVDKDKIRILTNNYKQIHHYDSIDTLKLKVTNFLIASLMNNENETENTKASSNENMIEIKCQFKDRKQPLLCHIHRNQPMSAIAKQCSSKVGCELEKIKLYFDGDQIKFDETPSSLEFEGGECVDIVIV